MYFPPLHPLSSGHISNCTIWQGVPNVIWEERGMQAMSAENSWVAVKFLWPEPAPQGKRNATTGVVSFHPSTNHPLETDGVCEWLLHRSWGFGMLLGGQIPLRCGRGRSSSAGPVLAMIPQWKHWTSRGTGYYCSLVVLEGRRWVASPWPVKLFICIGFEDKSLKSWLKWTCPVLQKSSGGACKDTVSWEVGLS